MVAAKPDDGTTRSVPVSAAALDTARLRAGALGRRFAVDDLVRCVDVGRRPPPRHRQQTRRWDLMGGVEGVQVAGEAAHHAEPESTVIGLIPCGRRAHATANSTVIVAAPFASR